MEARFIRHEAAGFPCNPLTGMKCEQLTGQDGVKEAGQPGRACKTSGGLRAVSPCVVVGPMHAFLASHPLNTFALAKGAVVAATVLNNNANNNTCNRGWASV